MNASFLASSSNIVRISRPSPFRAFAFSSVPFPDRRLGGVEVERRHAVSRPMIGCETTSSCPPVHPPGSAAGGGGRLRSNGRLAAAAAGRVRAEPPGDCGSGAGSSGPRAAGGSGEGAGSGAAVTPWSRGGPPGTGAAPLGGCRPPGGCRAPAIGPDPGTGPALRAPASRSAPPASTGCSPTAHGTRGPGASDAGSSHPRGALGWRSADRAGHALQPAGVVSSSRGSASGRGAATGRPAPDGACPGDHRPATGRPARCPTRTGISPAPRSG